MIFFFLSIPHSCIPMPATVLDYDMLLNMAQNVFYSNVISIMKK